MLEMGTLEGDWVRAKLGRRIRESKRNECKERDKRREISLCHLIMGVVMGGNPASLPSQRDRFTDIRTGNEGGRQEGHDGNIRH